MYSSELEVLHASELNVVHERAEGVTRERAEGGVHERAEGCVHERAEGVTRSIYGRRRTDGILVNPFLWAVAYGWHMEVHSGRCVVA